ncbi:uncharacterized protein JCM6883_000168 [Sporobolomyces salmoneus]|uniref:uncharacterized protein n=1 Tax=Sporobolomyces salmoneus TaxID=183962 RepID=UPI003181483C
MSDARPLSTWLGLATHVRPLQVFAALSTAAFSISLLVFISAATPFLLTSLLDVPANRTGDITGTLILADELTALGLYLPVGGLCDRFGVKYVASGGYLVVSIALVFYVQCRKVWELVLVRILFAAGAASLVATISAILSSLSAIPQPRNITPRTSFSETSEPISERTPLSNDRARDLSPNRSGRLAGMLGFSSGLGALLAVFGFLRLPNLLSRYLISDSPDPLARALMITFYLVAALSFLEGVFVFCALPGRSGPLSREVEGSTDKGFRKVTERLAKRLGMGFVIAKGNRDVSLALLTSFATRAQAVIVTAIIPLLVNRYFLNNDLCPSPSSEIPGPPNKHSCREAYVLASILTGIVQLVTLLLSPLVGLIASSSFLSRVSRHPQAAVLASSFLLGSCACAGFASLPNGDPRLHLVWLYAIGLGIAQAAGTVVSLALVTKGRGTIVANEGKEVGGSLSSAYSFSGGLGILLIGSTGGMLFDRLNSGAPFLLLGIVNLLVAISSLRVYYSPYDHDEPCI